LNGITRPLVGRDGVGANKRVFRALSRVPTLALPTLRCRFAGEGIACIDTIRNRLQRHHNLPEMGAGFHAFEGVAHLGQREALVNHEINPDRRQISQSPFAAGRPAPVALAPEPSY
jgi:hypothetical protein